MAELGWIKLHRKMLEWEWFSDRNVFHVFIILLLSANHEDNKWRGVTIKKGQCLTSLDSLSKQTKLSVAQVRLALKKLAMTNEIAIKTTSLNTLVSISNWEKYQDINTQDDKVNSKRTTKQNSKNLRISEDDNQKISGKIASDIANGTGYESGCNTDDNDDYHFENNKPNNKPITNGQQTDSKRTANEIATNKKLENEENEKNVVGNEPFFEFFRRVAGPHISDDELMHEIAKFKNKYPNIHPNRAGALINTWVANIGKDQPQSLTQQKPRIVV